MILRIQAWALLTLTTVILIVFAANGFGSEFRSDVFAVAGTNGTDGGFTKLIELMKEKGLSLYETPQSEGLLASDDVVLIKVNCQWDQRGGTNTDLLKCIIQSVLDHPAGFIGEIIVADNGQAQYGPYGGGGSFDWTLNNALDKPQSVSSVVAMFSDKKVSTYIWDDITRKKVAEYSAGDYKDGFIVSSHRDPDTGLTLSYPKFRTKYGTLVSFKEGIWDETAQVYDHDRLKVINVPVLKAHAIFGVTASVKHYMGTTSDKLTYHNAHNSVGTGGMGVQLSIRLPVLNVIDAIWVNAKRGPKTPYSSATEMNTIIASVDPIALDYWAAKNILIPAAKKNGGTRFDSIDPDFTISGYFGSWLRLSMEQLKKAGIPAVLNPGQDAIHVIDL